MAILGRGTRVSHFGRGVRWGGAALTAAAALSAAALALPAPAQAGLPGGSSSTEYIVSAPGDALSTILNDVVGVGAPVVGNFAFINTLAADLDPSQVSMLEGIPGLVVTPDVTVNVQGSSGGSSGRAPAAVFPEQSGASELWAQGNTGQGVNVAVLDTGITPLPDFAGRLVDGVDLSGGNNPWDDQYGHGTFVAGLIAGNGASSGRPIHG